VFKTVFKPFLVTPKSYTSSWPVHYIHSTLQKPSNPTSPVPPVYKPVDIFKTETLWVEDSSAD
jgi:hypothetical protein